MKESNRKNKNHLHFMGLSEVTININATYYIITLIVFISYRSN